MKRKHVIKHRHNPEMVKNVKRIARKHKRNPSAEKGKKFSWAEAGINTGLVLGGFVGNTIVKSYVSPIIPGYSSLTGYGTKAADAAIAIGIPVGLAFLLPVFGIKKDTARKFATMLGAGMLTNVAVSVISSMTSTTTSGLLTGKKTGVAALINSSKMPTENRYGLSAQATNILGSGVKNPIHNIN
jgi:hypothetical protein